MRLRKGSLHLGYGIRIHACGRVEKHARRDGCLLGIGIALARHLLKHPSTTQTWKCMLVQAGAEPVDKGHSADVQGSIVHVRCTGAIGRLALRNNAQEDAQHHVEHWPVALHKVA